MKYNHNGILTINSKDINVNDVLKLGSEEYRVLHKENNQALLITNKIIDVRRLHYSFTRMPYGQSSTREYLTHNYLIDKFKRDFLPLIKKVNSDKIFLLSIEETSMYFKDNHDRKAIDKFKTNECWWLRDQNDEYKSYYVNKDGSISKSPISIDRVFGLRPAFWLKLDEKIDWNKLNPMITPNESNIKLPFIGMDEEKIENTQCGVYYIESMPHYYTWRSYLDCNFLSVECKDGKVISVHTYYPSTHWNEDDSPIYGGIKFKK